MGRSKNRQTGAADRDETGNRKRPRSIEGKTPNMIELSVDQYNKHCYTECVVAATTNKTD